MISAYHCRPLFKLQTTIKSRKLLTDAGVGYQLNVSVYDVMYTPDGSPELARRCP